MATFVQLAEKDPAEYLVVLLSTLRFKSAEQKEQQTKFSAEMGALAKAHKYSDLIEKAFFTSLNEILDADPEQINASFNLAFALFNEMDAATVGSFTERFAAALASRKEHAALKIKLLTILFNMLESRSPQRHKVFVHIVSLALATDTAGVLAFQLSKLEDWMNEWQLSAADRAGLYLLASQLADATQQRDKHQQFMLKYLRALQDTDEKTLATAKEHAVRAAVIAIQSPQLIDCDTLLSYKAVQQLKDDSKYSATHGLLQVLATGNVASFNTFCSEHKGHLEQLGLNHDVLLSKMRVLTLISLGKASPRLSYDEVKKHLLLSNDDEVESRVIEAVMSGHVDAKLDQDTRTVIVERTAPRTFDKETWQQLHKKLAAWKGNVHRVLGTLSAIRQQHHV